MNTVFAEKAVGNTPEIYKKCVLPTGTVKVAPDNSFFGYKAEPAGETQKVFSNQDSMILDFGNHYVGYLSFDMKKYDIYLDAPVRLKFKFGESPYEIARDFSTYDGGLCKSWFQEESVTVDYTGRITLPRRYCFRYVEITVIATPQKIILDNFTLEAVTSADERNFVPIDNNEDEKLAKIDLISAKTLADCMQLVYEDGPKRDRRLWIGDFRLQALTDAYLFRNQTLVKRCLYLFAACEEEGKYLPCCLYYYPELCYNKGMGIMDYAFLYCVALCDYYDSYRDIETVKELFPVAKRQIDLAINTMNGDGIVTFPGGWDSFIDWVDGIKNTISVQGVLMYALERMIDLAKEIGEVDISAKYENELMRARENSLKHLYNADKNAFISSYDDNQYSVHSQVWMILGGMIGGKKAEEMLKNSLSDSDSKKPVTPYMHHYVVEAFVKLGLIDEAKEYIINYWGEMADMGADTFYEVFVKGHPEISPYGDSLPNSLCHAWSCTPSYFIRKYFIEK